MAADSVSGTGWPLARCRSPRVSCTQKSLVDAGRPLRIPSRDVYANNPNSYINHVRDNGFVDRYSADRREIPQYRYAGAAQRCAPTANARPRAQARSCPCPAFITRKNNSVWPADAPTDGELKEKREVSDKACDVVLEEKKKTESPRSRQ